jgi:hypothetical protein
MTEIVCPARGLGWRPELPDARDRKFAFRHALADEIIPEDKLPVRSSVPWRKSGPDEPADHFPVLDQLNEGSCTGHGGASLFGLVTGLSLRSRQALYYGARKRIGEQNIDGGAYIRDIFKELSEVGAGAEKLWPYQPDNIFTEPSAKYYADAAKHKLKTYHRLDTGSDDTALMMRSCLAHRYPFEIGFTCYASFVAFNGVVEKTGILNLPAPGESDEGGHAVCVIDYDREFLSTPRAKYLMDNGLSKSKIPDDVFIVRNSWGPQWGWAGNFVVDARYFIDSDLADDAWTGRR